MFFNFKWGSLAADVKVCPVGGMSSGCGFLVVVASWCLLLLFRMTCLVMNNTIVNKPEQKLKALGITHSFPILLKCLHLLKIILVLISMVTKLIDSDIYVC